MSDEIEAARIAADAAIQAAWVQGGLTLVAGGAAVIGGWLAYRGAVRAAERQVRLEERRDKARADAYRFRIETVLADLDRTSTVCLSIAEVMVATFQAIQRSYKDPDQRSYKDPDSFPIYPIPLSEELLEGHWEDHALLGTEVVRAIHNLRLQLREYTDFCNEVLANKLHAGDIAPGRHARLTGELAMVISADGSAEFPRTNVVETNEILTREIRSSVESFGAALAGSVSGIPGGQKLDIIPPIIA